jgi:polar amino acid transport system substrate-binding protein
MRNLVTNLTIVLGIALLAALAWAGQQRPADPYLQDIRARGVLRVGLDPTYPPFDMLQDGRPAGYDVALANAIAADLGVRAEFHTLALDTLYDALASEQVDVLASALPFIYERQKEVRYSVAYYQSGQVLVVPAGSSIRTPQNLAGHTVAVELGSNADTYARRLTHEITPTFTLLSTFHSPDEALQAVARGEAGAAITDHLSARTHLASQPGSLRILDPPLTDEPYVIVMPVRADALAASVNSTIERLRASGELAKIMGLDPR